MGIPADILKELEADWDAMTLLRVPEGHRAVVTGASINEITSRSVAENHVHSNQFESTGFIARGLVQRELTVTFMVVVGSSPAQKDGA